MCIRDRLGAYYFREGGTLHDYVTFDEGLLQVDGFNTFDTVGNLVGVWFLVAGPLVVLAGMWRARGSGVS